MAAPAYIQTQDYATYGIAGALDSQVAAASRIVDAQLGRPEGLIWSTDANGNPAWMAARTPTRSFALAAPMSPGSNVTVSFANALFGPTEVGSVVILDRSNSDAAEACVVTAVAGNTVTLGAVQFAHDTGATLEFGLANFEESIVVYGGMVRIAARPIARILSVSGSYRAASRHRRDAWIDELALIGNSSAQEWNAFPIAQCEMDVTTGVCWLLPGTVPSGYARVRVSYVAGWSYDALPEAIKWATANIVTNLSDAADNEMPRNATLLKAGNATIMRAAATAVDDDTARLLMPYRMFRVA